MIRLPLPRRRRYRLPLLLGGGLLLYLLVIAGIRALTCGGPSAEQRRADALGVVGAENWGLVTVEQRQTLARAIDDAWRGLRAYRMRYITGMPAALEAGGFETEATSQFVLDGEGRISAQRDSSFLSAVSPASGGREERFEGFRLRTAGPRAGRAGGRRGDVELIYQRFGDGVWVCEQSEASPLPPPLPGLELENSGDAGFWTIDGRPVRGFQVPLGAFGLRAPAVVWVDRDSLLPRAMESASSLHGRVERWQYSAFDEPAVITPPAGIVCQDG